MASKSSWLTPGNIVAVGALAGGGYLVYKIFVDNSSTTAPEGMQQGVTDINSILDKINSGDQSLLAMFSQLLGQQTQQPDINITIPGYEGGGTTLPNPDSSLPDDVDPEQADDLLHNMNEVLDLAGYGSAWDQYQAMNRLDHMENVLESYQNPVTGFLENTGQSLQDSSDIGALEIQTPVSTLVSALKPSTWKDAIDRIGNIPTAVGTWWDKLTG